MHQLGIGKNNLCNHIATFEPIIRLL